MASLLDKVTGKDGATAKPSKQGNELRKLRRQDLLELLVAQMRENDGLRTTIDKRDKTIEDLESLTERLKDKLNLKDEQIEHLKDRLNDKDVQMARLTPKLDDKDAQIERLKKRLDSKDLRIEQLETRVYNIARAEGMITLEELLVMEEQFLDGFARMHGFVYGLEQTETKQEGKEAQESKAEDGDVFEPEAEEEIAPESDAKVESEVESEEGSEAEPEPEPDPMSGCEEADEQ